MDVQHLITVDDVKARMALDPTIDINAFILSAIEAAQLHVATIFGSELFKVTGQTDTFFLDPEANNGLQPRGFYRLRLRRGLLLAAPVLTKGLSWDDPAPVAMVAGTDYRILNDRDLEQGIVLVPKTLPFGPTATFGNRFWSGFGEFCNPYINVTYTAGYNEGDDLPDWLKEAILAYVPVVFNFGPQTQRDQEAQPGYQASGDHAQAVLAPHNRFQSIVLKPL